jgi:hypothetical protein
MRIGSSLPARATCLGLLALFRYDYVLESFSNVPVISCNLVRWMESKYDLQLWPHMNFRLCQSCCLASACDVAKMSHVDLNSRSLEVYFVVLLQDLNINSTQFLFAEQTQFHLA